MALNHEAIYRAYPNVVSVSDSKGGAFDADGNQIKLDQALINAAAIEVAAEQIRAETERNRAAAYVAEADPLFFKSQRGEATTAEWEAKVAEIKARYPYPDEA